MSQVASNFVGSIPEYYDTGLGPNIFVDYAADIADRAAQSGAKKVLELAAGTGIVSRELRNRLPEDCHLVVTDLNGPMLAIAEQKFASDEAVSFQEANAQELPFDDDSFDLIICQFGVMFFPDKIQSFREAARVLKPSGRYIFNTWGSLEQNPFAQIALDVAAHFYPDDPPAFYKVPFAYWDAEEVRSDLSKAGWREVTHHSLPKEKIVEDVPAFARAAVFGNPMIEEIRQRGGVDPEDVVARLTDCFIELMGENPSRMPLLAHVFEASYA